MAKPQKELEDEIQRLKEEVRDLKYEKRIESLENKLEQKQHSEESSEFIEKLGDYKSYIVLSIFFDIFFLFSVLVFVTDSHLETIKKQYEIEPKLKNSFSNWKTFFIIIFIFKIIGVIILLVESLS